MQSKLICFERICEETTIISILNVGEVIRESVYWTVRTEFLNIFVIQTILSL